MAGIGTYGLGTSVRTPAGGPPGLASVAGAEQQQATATLGQVARMETERNMANKASAQAQKQGALGLAASGGATGAMVGGPWGAAIGGTLGLIAGGLF